MSLRSHVQYLPINSRTSTLFVDGDARGFAVTEGRERV